MAFCADHVCDIVGKDGIRRNLLQYRNEHNGACLLEHQSVPPRRYKLILPTAGKSSCDCKKRGCTCDSSMFLVDQFTHMLYRICLYLPRERHILRRFMQLQKHSCKNRKCQQCPHRLHARSRMACHCNAAISCGHPSPAILREGMNACVSDYC